MRWAHLIGMHPGQKILLFLCLCTIPNVQASPQETLEQVEQKLQYHQKRETGLKQETEHLKKELKKLRHRLVQSAGLLRYHEQDLNQIEQTLKTLHQQKKAKRAEVVRRYRQAMTLTTSLTRLSRVPRDTMLFQSERPIDTVHRALLLRTAIPEIKNRSNQLQKDLDNLSTLHKALLQNRTWAHKAALQIVTEKKRLDNLIHTREKFYRLRQKDYRAQSRKVQKLADTAHSLQELVKKFETPSPRTQKLALTRFIFPVTGETISSYGEEDSFGFQHKGMTFAIRRNKTVVSPQGGRVQFAGPFRSYKNILILEHLGGYYSMITGLEHIKTRLGEDVLAGEPIATAKEKVYYELRFRGTPIDPAPFLAYN